MVCTTRRRAWATHVQMKKQRIVWSLWIFLLVTSSASGVYYNEQRLHTYMRLSQQLRYQLADRIYDLLSRATTASPIPALVLSSIEATQAQMENYLIALEHRIDDVATLAGIRLTPALTVRPADDFPPASITKILFNDVEMSHGIMYTTRKGDAQITKSGVYLMELKTHQQPITYNFKIKIHVVRPGIPKATKPYKLQYTFAISESPIFEILHLHAGDILDTKNLKVMGNTAILTYGGQRILYVGGLWNQLNLRYLGEIPSP